MLPAIGLAEISTILAQHMIAMLRIGAFLLASPVFGGRLVPLPVRVMATAIIALPVLVSTPLPEPEVIADLRFVPVALTELAIGLVSGLILTILFGAASIAGDRIAATAGLGFAAQFDPAGGGQTPVVATIFSLILMSVFLGTDGHLSAIRLLLGTYETLPIGSSFQLEKIVITGMYAGGLMFALGSTIMLPVVTVLLLLNIVIGVLTRSAPQLNVFSFGFPITMSAAMLLIFLFAPGLVSSFQTIVDEGLRIVSDVMVGSNG